MPLPERKSGMAFENFINNNRFKSTESTVYLNNMVNDSSFHTDCWRRNLHNNWPVVVGNNTELAAADNK